jgi:phosphatidylserine/phosphatidylglycerophosphate/cardiolipin synthase-like enzyme
MAAAHYRALLEGGVHIYEFAGNGSLKAMEDVNSCELRPSDWNGATLHSKLAVFDGAVAMVGSNNMNARSFHKNSEVMALVNESSFSSKVEALFQDHFNSLNEQRFAFCSGRPLRKLPTVNSITLETLPALSQKYSIKAPSFHYPMGQ